MPAPPWPTASNVLVVAYFASAELGCYLALGWPMPPRILDLFAEFRCRTNGRALPHGAGLLGALTYFGIDSVDAIVKESMRSLAMRGGPFSEKEKRGLVEYCASDVTLLGNLLQAMVPSIDLPRALLRGRYMAAVARMESVGVPIDVEMLARFRANWSRIKAGLINATDARYGVFEDGSFSQRRFTEWLVRSGIQWPSLESGQLDLKDDTFRDMARLHPEVGPLRDVRHVLSQLRLDELAVGSDGRNRCLLSPFQAKTSRNQPSTSRFIFGPACWLRGLIRPAPGKAIAYLDYAGQEIGIAAALSNDPAMQDAYRSGDPYLFLAKAGGFAPADATKATHGGLRDIFKIVYLAANYGMGARGLSFQIGQPEPYARQLLWLHRKRFSTFWSWSEEVQNAAMLTNRLNTVFGWRIHVGPDARATSLRNFPVQANGAAMLRLACCLATERGVRVCCPVHVALLIEADEDEIEVAVRAAKGAMLEAAEVVLDGFSLRIDDKIVPYPERHADPRGAKTWEVIQQVLAEVSAFRGKT